MIKRKILIVLGSIAGLVVLAIVVALLSLITVLPSSKELAQKLPGKPSAKPQAPATQLSTQTQAVESATITAQSAVASETTEEKAKREKKEQDAKNEALFERLITEDSSDIRVCDNLGRTVLTPEELKRERSFDEMMLGRDDAMNEAFRAPILGVFKDPNLQNFIGEVKEIKAKTENASDAEKESWFEKAGFYSRMALTGARVLARKSEFEHMGNQSAHLMALAKLTALKPELAASPKIQTLCRMIEGSEKEGLESDLVQDRRELVEIFRDAGVDPKTVGWDPSKWIHFTMKLNKKQLAFNLTDEAAPEGQSAKKTKN